MKKNYILSAISLFLTLTVSATVHTVSISGTSYSPSMVSAFVGDTVTISASSAHPLVEIDATEYAANGSTPMSGGWGTKTSTYTFKITTTADIYFSCANHAGFGMKGMIMVSPSSVSSVDLTSAFSIYPNPAVIGSEFTISLTNTPGKKQVSFYSMTGQLLQTIQVSEHDRKINVTLAAGSYYCEVAPINSKDVFRKKIVVLQ